MNLLRCLAGLAFAGTLAAAPLNPDLVTVTGITNGNPLEYAPGEKMIFTFWVNFGGQFPEQTYYLDWERTGDDGKVERGRERCSGREMAIETSLDHPGFVRISAKLVDAGGRTLLTKNSWGQPMECGFEGGAAVEPGKLAGSPEPADFDAFWQGEKVRLAKVPVRYRLEKQPYSTPEVEVYAVSVDCAGPRPVTGYLAIPAGAKERSLPALADYAGYGAGAQSPPWELRRDRIAFHVNAHGFELNRDNAYYREFERSISTGGQGYAFDKALNSNPETAYFNGMALRVMRSLEFLKSLPQWDGKHLTVYGGSQGGLQAVWGAALDADVTMCRIDIPWCCDLAGPVKSGRLSGWRPEYTDALRYYDAANFAKRIGCPVEIMRAGLGDYTCPPSGIAVLYNNIRTPKRIVWVQGSTHGYVPPNPERFEFTD